MSIEFLLDANSVSELIKGAKGELARKVQRVGSRSICTSIIAAAELRFGYHRKGSSRLRRAVEDVIDRLTVRPFESPADFHYAELRAALERGGNLIGANDMLIAAHALALDCTLVTANEREFRRVPGLRVENWLA